MKKWLLILIIYCPVLLCAQAPNIHWQKVYGGNGNERLDKIIQTTDGGYLLGGESESGISGDKTVTNYGSSDYWIIKTNAIGEIQWQKNLGGSSSDSQPIVIETTDGGFLVGGSSQSNISGNKTENTHGFNDFWVIKLDYNGTIEWQNTIGANFSDLLSSVIQTPDGGYLLAGSSVSDNSGDKTENNVGFPFGLPYYTYFDYWVIKIDALGNIQWDNTIGSKLTDGATVAVNASDSGYLIGGYTYCDVSGDQTEPCYGDIDGWILKLDLDGNILWQKKFGGNNRDMLQTMISTSDGGYLFGFDSNSNISGQKTENNLGGKDYWIIKVDAFGTVLWDKTIGGSSDDVITDLKEDNNGNYYAVGFSNSNISGNKTQNSIGGYDNWVMKLNSDGNIIWDKTIGGSDNDYNSSFEYLVTDDSLIIGGTSNSPISGDKTADTRGLYDYWIVKLESDHLKSTAFEDSKISVFPNPTAKDISIDLQQTFQNIHLKLINPLGQLIFEKKYTDTSKIELTLDGSKGVYFLHLTNPNDEKLIFKIAKE